MSKDDDEYFKSSSKKGRGRSQKSLDMIEAMYQAAKSAHPVSGRGIGYKLFVAGVIPSMKDMDKVYRLLKVAREQSDIPWEWIVDETRALEKTPTWDDPEDYARYMARWYRRDFWNQQPVRVEVWSEKGTVRGVLDPVLEKYAVGFLPVHGYTSATSAHNIAEDDDGRKVTVLYVGDYDPSGMDMSERDLPKRLAQYGGHHITVKRIALTKQDTRSLPSFPASDKKKDRRCPWFVRTYGDKCWELDAMDPNDLRDRVEEEIKKLIELEAWERCDRVNKAEHESMRAILSKMPGQIRKQMRSR